MPFIKVRCNMEKHTFFLYSLFFLLFCKYIQGDSQNVNLYDDIKHLNTELYDIMNKLPLMKGDMFINKIKLYNDKMSEFGFIVKKNREKMQPKLISVLDLGYPSYLEEDVLIDQMKDRFNWTETDLKIFTELRTESYNVWADLIMLHKYPHKYL